MPNLVLVHGAGNSLWGPASIHAKWYPAVLDGLSWHGVRVDPDDVRIAFYGDLFRPDPESGYRPPVDQVAAVARFSHLMQGVDPHVDLDEMIKVMNEQHLDKLLAQATAYFDDAPLHAAVQQRMEAVVDEDTVAVVAHSLGTVVAYETLCRHPEWGVSDFVTVGSPLGGAVIKAALESNPGARPAPWPGSVQRWTNIRGAGDPVCLDDLAPHFDGLVVDREVDNGHRVHDPEPYLNNPTTGKALAVALGR